MFPKLIISVIYFLLGGFAHFGDIIVSNIEPRFYTWRSITDNTFHFFIAILTWILVYYHSNSKCYVFSSLVYECLLTGLIGSAVDVDHFVVARTFSVKTAINHISISRPFLHHTTLWFLVCGFLSLAHYNLAVLILTSAVSHHLRDAVRRGLSFYPFFSTPPLPSMLYLGLILALPVISSHCLQSNVNKTSKHIFQV